MTGSDIIKVRDSLKSQRGPFVTEWQELAELFMPFRNVGCETPDIPRADVIFDSTPRQAALIMANGLATLICPREEIWFEYQPPKPLADDDDAIAWYRRCSAIARDFIEGSNFYEEIQECLIESPVFGTTALWCGDLDDYNELYFRNQPVGTYYIGEDSRGRVNCVYRDLQLTAEQAKDEFGEDALPEEIRKHLGKADAKTELFSFVHAVYRRDYEVSSDAPDSAKLPWVSETIYEKSKTTVQRTGFHEFPFAVHRYRRFGRAVYGVGPGSVAKGDARQLSLLNELADIATEKAVFPAVEAPSSMEGEIDLGAMAINYRDDASSPGQIQPIDTDTRFDVAFQRLQDKREQINQAFHVDLFKLFSNRSMERAPLTATEASLVAGEKLTQFSPVFGRLVSEMLDVILSRVFGVLFRAGYFPDIPDAVLLATNGRVALPSILYKNKIVLAQQARQNGSLMEFFNIVMPIITADPSMMPVIFDSFKVPRMTRDVARNSGFPEGWLETLEDTQAKSQARQQAQQEAQQMQMAEQASKAAANVSKLPPAALGAVSQAL